MNLKTKPLWAYLTAARWKRATTHANNAPAPSCFLMNAASHPGRGRVREQEKAQNLLSHVRGKKKKCQETLETHPSENNLLHDPEENSRLMLIVLFLTSFIPELDTAPLTPRPLRYPCSRASLLLASTLQTLVQRLVYSFHCLAFSNCSVVTLHCFYNNF